MKENLKRISKSITVVISLCCVMLLGVFSSPKAQAATLNYEYLYDSGDCTGYKDSVYNATVSVKNSKITYLVLYALKPTDVNVTVKKANGSQVVNRTFQYSDSDWKELRESLYACGMAQNLAKGTYQISVQFLSENAEYRLMVGQEKSATPNKPKAKINNTKAYVTAGFTKTLKVSNASGKITWKSNNKKIATVNKKGKVTAKKAGHCTIYATTKDKQKLKCKITVQKNEYSRPSYKNSDVKIGKVNAYVKNMHYNSKGNLVIKIRLLNNSSHYIHHFENFSVKVKTLTGKYVGTYRKSKLNVQVGTSTYKSVTVTLKKSKMKFKKVNLRSCQVSTGGKYVYVKYR